MVQSDELPFSLAATVNEARQGFPAVSGFAGNQNG
jgi:hypothetical protein